MRAHARTAQVAPALAPFIPVSGTFCVPAAAAAATTVKCGCRLYLEWACILHIVHRNAALHARRKSSVPTELATLATQAHTHARTHAERRHGRAADKGPSSLW